MQSAVRPKAREQWKDVHRDCPVSDLSVDCAHGWRSQGLRSHRITESVLRRRSIHALGRMASSGEASTERPLEGIDDAFIYRFGFENVKDRLEIATPEDVYLTRRSHKRTIHPFTSRRATVSAW